jgi:hypothetical protein
MRTATAFMQWPSPPKPWCNSQNHRAWRSRWPAPFDDQSTRRARLPRGGGSGITRGFNRGASFAFGMSWRRGREAEGGGLLNRYRVVKPYRGFESLRLRQRPFSPTITESQETRNILALQGILAFRVADTSHEISQSCAETHADCKVACKAKAVFGDRNGKKQAQRAGLSNRIQPRPLFASNNDPPAARESGV